VEAVAVVLMLLGSLNFATAWLMLRGRLRDVSRDGEVRLVALLIPLGALTLVAGVCGGLYPTLEKSIRCYLIFSVTISCNGTACLAGKARR
jgi:trk system potassium uptake protein TrkH